LWIRKLRHARRLWLTLIILATQETEIGRIAIRSQSRKIVCKTISQKNLSQKRTGGVAQGVDPEFKPQYHKKRKLRHTRG
jgi:hypothetical protein